MGVGREERLEAGKAGESTPGDFRIVASEQFYPLRRGDEFGEFVVGETVGDEVLVGRRAGNERSGAVGEAQEDTVYGRGGGEVGPGEAMDNADVPERIIENSG